MHSKVFLSSKFESETWCAQTIASLLQGRVYMSRMNLVSPVKPMPHLAGNGCRCHTAQQACSTLQHPTALEAAQQTVAAIHRIPLGLQLCGSTCGKVRQHSGALFWGVIGTDVLVWSERAGLTCLPLQQHLCA